MARVRGIVVDSLYLVTCDVVERAEFELGGHVRTDYGGGLRKHTFDE
jgi:hypothetical protein